MDQVCHSLQQVTMGASGPGVLRQQSQPICDPPAPGPLFVQPRLRSRSFADLRTSSDGRLRSPRSSRDASPPQMQADSADELFSEPSPMPARRADAPAPACPPLVLSSPPPSPPSPPSPALPARLEEALQVFAKWHALPPRAAAELREAALQAHAAAAAHAHPPSPPPSPPSVEVEASLVLPGAVVRDAPADKPSPESPKLKATSPASASPAIRASTSVDRLLPWNMGFSRSTSRGADGAAGSTAAAAAAAEPASTSAPKPGASSAGAQSPQPGAIADARKASEGSETVSLPTALADFIARHKLAPDAVTELKSIWETTIKTVKSGSVPYKWDEIHKIIETRSVSVTG